MTKKQIIETLKKREQELYELKKIFEKDYEEYGDEDSKTLKNRYAHAWIEISMIIRQIEG